MYTHSIIVQDSICIEYSSSSGVPDHGGGEDDLTGHRLPGAEIYMYIYIYIYV